MTVQGIRGKDKKPVYNVKVTNTPIWELRHTGDSRFLLVGSKYFCTNRKIKFHIKGKDHVSLMDIMAPVLILI